MFIYFKQEIDILVIKLYYILDLRLLTRSKEMVAWMATAILSVLSFALMVHYTVDTFVDATTNGGRWRDTAVTAVMAVISGIIACLTWFGDVAWFVIRSLFQKGSNLEPGTGGTILVIVLLIILVYVARLIRAKG